MKNRLSIFTVLLLSVLGTNLCAQSQQDGTDKIQLTTSFGSAFHYFDFDELNQQENLLGIPRNFQVTPELSIGFGKANGLSLHYRFHWTLQKKSGDISNYNDVQVVYSFWRNSLSGSYCIRKGRHPLFVELGTSVIMASLDSRVRDEAFKFENAIIKNYGCVDLGISYNFFTWEKHDIRQFIGVAARYEIPFRSARSYLANSLYMPWKPKIDFGGPSITIYYSFWGTGKANPNSELN